MSLTTDLYIFLSSRISNRAQLVIGKNVRCFEGKSLFASQHQKRAELGHGGDPRRPQCHCHEVEALLSLASRLAGRPRGSGPWAVPSGHQGSE